MAVGENNLQVQISLLRKTLQEDTSGESYLVTVPGRDYRLVGHSRRSQAAHIVAERFLRPGQVSRRVTKFTQSPPKWGYHSVDQKLRPIARFPMNVAIGKTKIRCCARLRGCYIAALVTHTAASAGDRVCQPRVAGRVGDRSRAFRRP
jgi:hypothetical protein